jgi:predicted Rossmann fold flavoprotein
LETTKAERWDVIIIGAGAAGLMAAIEAGKRGRRVLILDRADAPGKKILISGGGRCNFTNRNADDPKRFLSSNPRFCLSALKSFRPRDFVALVEKHRVPYHEKKLGQLFCDRSARDILNLLLREAEEARVSARFSTAIERVDREESGFRLRTSDGLLQCPSLVVASGGLSLPKIGATDFGFRLARQFGLKIIETRAGLVPLLLEGPERSDFNGLQGVSADAIASADGASFRENILFTHRGLSGPAILQVSSYWRPGEVIRLNLAPDFDAAERLRDRRAERPKAALKTILAEWLPTRLAERLTEGRLGNPAMGQLSNAQLAETAQALQALELRPAASEGYKTAEVTVGGVDTDELSSKTMEAQKVPGLYFVGEVVDVTGWLGGYNFQWAWASGWKAGQFA